VLKSIARFKRRYKNSIKPLVDDKSLNGLYADILNLNDLFTSSLDYVLFDGESGEKFVRIESWIGRYEEKDRITSLAKANAIAQALAKKGKGKGKAVDSNQGNLHAFFRGPKDDDGPKGDDDQRDADGPKADGGRRRSDSLGNWSPLNLD
jgi:hypothetical protein